MKRFMGKNFLLETDAARELYHDIAAELSICDFLSRIPAKTIAENEPFESITQAWLANDPCKWHVMRALGVPEPMVTGNASDEEKFVAWAEVLPQLAGHPLYHHAHLELQRVFSILTPLSPKTALEIWHACNSQIENLPPQALLAKQNVKALCTVEDPSDSLRYHQQLRDINHAGATILPVYSTENAMDVGPQTFITWHASLEACVGFSIHDFETLTQALILRMEFFHATGCRLATQPLCFSSVQQPDRQKANEAFAAALLGDALTQEQTDVYRTTLLNALCKEYTRLGWTFVLADSNAHSSQYTAMFSSLLNMLQSQAEMPKILCLPAGNIGSIIQAMGRAPMPHGISLGAAGLQPGSKDSLMALLSGYAGHMPLSTLNSLTASAATLLSFPQHEYSRRILCNLLGHWMENGEYPVEYKALGKIIRAVSYENAMEMLNLEA